MRKAIQMYDEPDFEQFQLLHMMRVAYEKSFTLTNVVRSFSVSGMFPVCAEKLIGTPRTQSRDLHSIMSGVKEMENLITAKRERLRQGHDIQPVVLRRGFVDTTQGMVLTREEAMKLVEKNEDLYRRKKQAAHAKEAMREQALEGQRLERRLARQKFESWALQRCVHLYGDAKYMLHPLRVHVALAKKRTSIENKM